jgi:putative transcriptional regulator
MMSKATERKKNSKPTISKKAGSRRRLSASELQAKMVARLVDEATSMQESKKGGTSKKRRTQKKQLPSGGAKIVAALEEAIEAMRAGRPLNVRTYHFAFPLREYSANDVRRVRGLFRMSQTVFADFLGVDANTIQSWEQEARPVSNLARRFLSEIEADPEYWQQRIARCIARSP